MRLAVADVAMASRDVVVRGRTNLEHKLTTQRDNYRVQFIVRLSDSHLQELPIDASNACALRLVYSQRQLLGGVLVSKVKKVDVRANSRR